MDIGTIVGLIVAITAMVVGALLGGGNLVALVDVPSLVIVFGGTIGAVAVSFPVAALLKVHKVFLKAFFAKSTSSAALIKDLVRFAEVARREGILALENHIKDMKEAFLVRGIKMAVDGTDPELIKTIMDIELEASMERHAAAKKILDTIGRMAPAFGMIGTLMGLVFMLMSMDDPSKIGPGMAVALLTTMYGALIANVCTGPLSEKLASRDSEEMLTKNIIIAGVMSIQSGDNPRVVESKLLTYLPPSQRMAFETKADQAA
ncbi:MAG: motility protein A [Phycisphaeraceae bacterium]|nr:motility protein A [Phycisphaeraceae bacterium]MCW5755148.1 motility protein A [Phycisphaeraceae bacterium]